MTAVTGSSEGDFLHVGLEAGQINGENAIGPFSTEANGTIFITGLPVKDHIAVTQTFPSANNLNAEASTGPPAMTLTRSS